MLDYAALSEQERIVVDMLYYGEFSLYDRRDLPCKTPHLKRLIKQGWIDHTKQRIQHLRYDQQVYHPAYYWISFDGAQAVLCAEHQARVDFYLRQKRTEKILCFPLPSENEQEAVSL